MNQGTAASVSATKNSTTNSAMNSGFACRAKCHRNADQPGRRLRVLRRRVGFRSFNGNICDIEPRAQSLPRRGYIRKLDEIGRFG